MSQRVGILIDKTGVGVHAGPTSASREERLTVGTFFSLANDTNVTGFWKDPGTRNLKTRMTHEILLGEEMHDRLFSAGKTLLDAFIQDILSMSTNLLLALYLVFPRYLFNMRPAFKFSRGVETLRIDRYLTLTLLTLKSGSIPSSD